MCSDDVDEDKDRRRQATESRALAITLDQNIILILLAWPCLGILVISAHPISCFLCSLILVYCSKFNFGFQSAF